jgi:hypothetical protein
MTLWTPPKKEEPKKPDEETLPFICKMAILGDPYALRVLEARIAGIGEADKQERYVTQLLQDVLGTEYEITTMSPRFHGNTIRHHFRTDELFAFCNATHGQRVKAVLFALGMEANP